VAPAVIATDGKTSRRTQARKKGREPLHLVSAWASRQRLAPGHQAVAGKSNDTARSAASAVSFDFPGMPGLHNSHPRKTTHSIPHS
jgi:hypothetical protein